MDKVFSSIALLVAWNLKSKNNSYYTLNTHYVYLLFLSQKYKNVYVISSVVNSNEIDNGKYCLDDFQNVKVIPLPEVTSSAKALLQLFKYKRAVTNIRDKVDCFYCRVPDPFCWMPTLIGRKPTIMHFVGDTIDATKYNENWTPLKKIIMIAGYQPDWWLTLKAARRSCVYCNGYHLVEKLSKKKIKATAVISSTVSKNDLPVSLPLIPHHKGRVLILFLSYIRYAKGINCLMDTLLGLKNRGIDFQCNIIGDGEMMPELKAFVKENGFGHQVTVWGQINDRSKINELMSSSDLFFFSSLSEGSPRVVVEAVSQGIPVLSTPVGSLPYTYKDGESIRFFPYNDSEAACRIITQFIENPTPFVKQRETAFQLMKDNFTLEAFLSKVFTYYES